MRIISLASGLVLACSLVAAPAMASAVSGVAAPSATSKPATRSEPAKAASKSKSATSAKKARAKGARKSVGPKSRVALARKSRLPRIDIDDLADRSTEAHASLLPERIYDGLLPGEGYTVAYPLFTDGRGRTECVELIKGLLGAPRTALWREGRKLRMNADQIQPGTAIATFVNGRYPNWQRRGSKHAAIFLRATDSGIYVLDQFAHRRSVKERFIPWHHPRDRSPSNNASSYSTVRW